MSATDLLDLLRRRLLEEGQPPAGPVSIAELHRRLLPYHVCRAELGYATKAEYDVAMLRFLAGGDVRLQEPEFGEELRRELASPEPGLAVLQRFAASEVRLPPSGANRPEVSSRPAPAAARKGAAGPVAPAAAGSAAPAATRVRTAQAAAAAEAAGPERPPEPTAAAASGAEVLSEAAARLEAARGSGAAAGCWRCGRPLPARPGARFCPHCGRDQQLRECGACGAELEVEWAFCVACGARQPAASR